MSIVSKAEVISIKKHGDFVREFLLKLDEFDTYEPGQFLQLSLDLVDASQPWPESRTFSIASYRPEEQTIRLVLKKEGPYTSRIFNELQVGSFCTVKYAYGDFMLPMFDEEEKIHCVAGGTGIAPFLSFVDYLGQEGGMERLHLHYSARYESDFIDLEEIKEMMVDNQLEVYCTRESVDGSHQRRIAIEDVLKNVINIADEHFYICGSNELIQHFKSALEARGAENIYTDEWS